MKKFLSLTIVFMMAASLTACGNSHPDQQSSIQSESSSTAAESEQSSVQPESSSSVAVSGQSSEQSRSSSTVSRPTQSSTPNKGSSTVSPQNRSSTSGKSGSATPSSRPRSSSAGRNSSQAASNSHNAGSATTDDARVRFSFNDESIVMDMNNSPTSKDFLSQLPLTLTFKNYSGSEKIAYPPRKLSTQGAPAGCDPEIGDLALFAPWGNLVLYYGDAGYYDGIIKMGHAESGIEKLSNMNNDFTVKIERIN